MFATVSRNIVSFYVASLRQNHLEIRVRRLSIVESRILRAFSGAKRREGDVVLRSFRASLPRVKCTRPLIAIVVVAKRWMSMFAEDF